jgi:ATP-binding cassette subfamily F protein 3
MLHINNLTYLIDGRPLIENATVAIPAGHKVGFVGRNGTGKSTLLRLILGEIMPDDGTINIPNRRKIGSVAQEAPAGDTTLLDTVLAADKERSSLLKEAESATDPNRIAEIQLRLTDIGAHSAEARGGAILSGLGFSATEQRRPCSEFSGGWRMRVALAAILFAEPDLLLLDEPTNYLDLEGTIWLENYLRTYPHTVLLVSHDRDLLNKAVGHILHLNERRLTIYAGGYDRFEKTRREQLELQLAMKKKQDHHRKHLESFVERFRYKASKAKQAQSRIKMLEKMQPIASMLEDRTVPFNFPNPDEMRSPIVRLEDVSVGYEPGKPVLKGLDLRIDLDDRIALLGANGNGKSTFAKVLAGRLDTMSGNLYRHKKLKIAYFAQHQLDELDGEETPFDTFRTLMGPEAFIAQVRAKLGSYGFGFEKADTKIKLLSGGEKARLLLAVATYHGPHILLLDEPTNHLDVDSREALVQALNEFEGCVILISHDRHLIEASADRLWLVADGGVKPYEGDLDDYQDLLLGRRPKGEEKSKPPANARQDTRRSAAERRKSIEPLKKSIQEFEKTLNKRQGDLEKLEKALAIPGFYQQSPQKAGLFARKRSEIVAEIERLEEEWLAASEDYEEARTLVNRPEDVN